MKVLMIGPSNLGPYHFARFRAIVKLILDFTYVRISTKEYFRPWSSNLDICPCRVINLEHQNRISKFLDKEQPDIIIVIGYNNWTLLRAAWWAKEHAIPCILQCDSQYLDKPRYRWKETLKSLIIRHFFKGAFVSGSRSAEYMMSLGIPESKIWRGVDVVDNEHFSKCNCKWKMPTLFPSSYFLTMARLSPEKNLKRLIRAFEIYRGSGGTWGLVIAGAGSLEKELKQSVPDNLVDSVYWYGWAGYEDLPSIYHGASCFILPSVSEPWGLVVNEAMAAGLPVLVSERCGCVPELCHEGVNGFTFNPFDTKRLAELMLKISSGLLDLELMGKASRKIISNYTPEGWANTLFEICDSFSKQE